MTIGLASVLELMLVLHGMQATVAGVVHDGGSGRPLAGAEVTLGDMDRATSTDWMGRYIVRDVLAGPQHLVVRHAGYALRTVHALVPPTGELEVDIALRPQPIALPALDVRPRVALRGLEGNEVGVYPDRRITIAAVRTHPQLAEPDVLQALTGGAVKARSESPDGLHVRGGASDQTAYIVDGIPVFSPYHAAGVFSAWNPDAIGELDLWSVSPSPAMPEALAGVVSARTRRPGPRFASQGSVSTTQARITMDGPVRDGGAGWLVALRAGYAGAPFTSDEASYLRGRTTDWLAKLEVPAAGGQLRVLGYGSGNAIDAAAAAGEAANRSGRNAFEWRSRSHGLDWTRLLSGMTVHLVGWRAVATAGAQWGGPDERAELEASRADGGVTISIVRPSARASTVAGVRLERRRTSYRVRGGAEGEPPVDLGSRTPLFAVFVQHTRSVQQRGGFEMGAALVGAAGSVHVSPRARAHWTPTDRLTVSGSWSYMQQFAQSLRNAESVVGAVFPADLWVGAGAPGVPVARGRQGTVSIDYRPSPALHLSGQAYARRDRGLLLVAPRERDPFSTGDFTVGSASAHGLSVDAAWSTSRYGLLASWGWQDLRLSYAESSYVPEMGMRHAVEAGGIVFPSATSSVRIGAAAALGRRTTPLRGGFEWESCNLLDAGCEFAGTPRLDGAVPGSAAVPSFFRVDAGVRKHWHIEWRDRDVQLALFGSLTNVFGRSNVWTWVVDPTTGERAAIEMRPFAPLVVGVDWRF